MPCHQYLSSTYSSSNLTLKKELLARVIHQLSNRCQVAFATANCAAIPVDMLESAFFGHSQSCIQLQAEPELSTLAEQGLEAYLANIEKKLLLQALDRCRWNKTSAAKKLGMSFRSLRYRLNKFGIDEQDEY